MALVIEIKVVPSSGKRVCLLDKKGQIKCYLKSAPENGRANKELVKMLSKALKVVQDDIEIILGATMRNKTVKIHTAITQDEFNEALGLAHQPALFE